MKKGIIYSLIAGVIALMSACGAKIQTYDFNEEYATTLHYSEMSGDKKAVVEEEKSDLVGVPALSFYGGDLKRGGIWWAGRDIYLEKGDEFVFEATNVGADSIPFGATFPPIDLVKVPSLLKISARSEGIDSASLSTTPAPMLYVQVTDADGYQTNAMWPSFKIENSTEFKDYYYDLRGIYNQNTPKKHKVNGTMINSLKFFINPGQTPYTGKIIIKEIKVVPASAVEEPKK